MSQRSTLIDLTFRMFCQVFTMGFPLWKMTYFLKSMPEPPRTTDSLLRELLGVLMVDPGRIDEFCTVLSFENRRTKAYEQEAAKAANPVVLQREMQLLEAMARSLHDAPSVRRVVATSVARHSRQRRELQVGDSVIEIEAGPYIVSVDELTKNRLVTIFKMVPKITDRVVIERAGWLGEAVWTSLVERSEDEIIRAQLVVVEEQIPHRTMTFYIAWNQDAEERLVEILDEAVVSRLKATDEEAIRWMHHSDDIKCVSLNWDDMLGYLI